MSSRLPTTTSLKVMLLRWIKKKKNFLLILIETKHFVFVAQFGRIQEDSSAASGILNVVSSKGFMSMSMYHTTYPDREKVVAYHPVFFNWLETSQVQAHKRTHFRQKTFFCKFELSMLEHWLFKTQVPSAFENFIVTVNLTCASVKRPSVHICTYIVELPNVRLG